MNRLTAALSRAAAVAAVAFGAFGVAGADTASATTRCSAHAITAIGTVVPRTKSVEVRKASGRACRAAVRDCELRLDRQRARTGFGFPYARCEVADRVKLRRGDGGGHASFKAKRRFAPEVRCVAKAFTRRGRELSNTRAVEIGVGERRACVAALNRCEHKLDMKRLRSGRGFPRASCEVVRSVELAGGPRF